MKGSDIREFLTNLCCKREELAATGVKVSDNEYQCTILKGIPGELATFASHLLSSALIVHDAAKINLDALTSQICKEVDRLKSQRPKGQGGKKDITDEALSATGSNDGKQQCHKGKCHNCGKLSHWAKACCSPMKDKEDSIGTQSTQSQPTSFKSENKPVGLANVVIHDFKGDGFWMAIEEAPDRTHLASTEPDPMLGTTNDDDMLHCEGEEIDDLGIDDWFGAVITSADEDHCMHVKLYNSGTTRHISPYKSNFTSYSPLTPPIFLNAANQQQFLAVGHGTLVIQVPNKGTKSQLTLQGALHMPAVSYTLMSLVALDKEGYHAHIGAGQLELISLQGEHVRHIPRMPGHLYKVVHALDSANVVEPMSVIELHRRLGHIAVESACKLVTSGAITGVELDLTSPEADCNVCIYTHTTRLPIPKIKISLPAKDFSDEIHTNVWRPAPTPTYQG